MASLVRSSSAGLDVCIIVLACSYYFLSNKSPLIGGPGICMLNAKRDHAARYQEVRHQLCRVIKCIFIVIPLHVNLRTS